MVTAFMCSNLLGLVDIRFGYGEDHIQVFGIEAECIPTMADIKPKSVFAPQIIIFY